jgi:hypothetical protein
VRQLLKACIDMFTMNPQRPAVAFHMIPRARMNSTNQQNEMKWMERAACRFSMVPSKPDRFEIAGLCIRPVAIETGAAINTVMK